MGSKQAPTEDIRDSVPALAENLCGLQSVAKVQLTLTKSEAAHYLWALAVQSNARKIEIAKANCLGYLVTLVGNGSQEGKYNAVGCLQHLTKCEDIRPDIIYNLAGVKQLTSIAKLLTGPHDRSRVCAAILLNQLSLIPEFSKMTVAIPYLVELLGITEPDWAGISVARSNAAVCLRNLAVTKEIYKDGGIPNLINMLGGGGNSIEGRTAAVSCLNILAEDDTGIQGLLKGNAIPALCRILEQPHNMDTIESKANAAGCLWNIVLEERTRMQVAREGGVPHLVMLLKGLAGEGGGKAKKKGKGKKDPPLPPAVDMAQRNAAGTIWHLSFSDENKVALGAAGAIEPLIKLLNSRNEGTRENATGALWNLALEHKNVVFFVAGKAPKYLLPPKAPVHPRWLGPRQVEVPEGGTLDGGRPEPLIVS